VCDCIDDLIKRKIGGSGLQGYSPVLLG
jgi:hypothetical protein